MLLLYLFSTYLLYAGHEIAGEVYDIGTEQIGKGAI